MKVLVEVSAHHVHLSQKDMEKLFGKTHSLKPIKILSQPKEFACKETVTLENKGKMLKNVRVLGPVRKNSQVELTATEAIHLGIRPALKISGNIKGTPGVTIKGPKGKIKLKQGVIIAERHLHCSKEQAKKHRLRNKQKVGVKVKGRRALTFDDVIVRVKPDFSLALHLDTDEGNAAGIKGRTYGKIIR